MFSSLKRSLRFLSRGDKQLAAVSRSLEQVRTRVRSSQGQIGEVKTAVQALGGRNEALEREFLALQEATGKALRAQGHVLDDLRRVAKENRTALQSSGDVWRLQAETRQRLTDLAGGREPILLGPWLSEVGFEVLYWIPFLRWVIGEFGIDPARITVLTRGGAGCWYDGLADGTIDILELVTVDQMRVENFERRERSGGSQKQDEVSAFEQDLINRVRQRPGLSDVKVLHPSLMYDLFRPVWRGIGLRTLDLWDKHCHYTPIAAPVVSPELDAMLPRDFIAVRFYDRPTFPKSRETASFVADLLERLSNRHDIVLLDPGFSADDHSDFEPPDLPRLHRVNHLMSAHDNLLVQSQVISRATAFVGTYGGLAYVPALYGVPSLSFFSGDAKFPSIHLDVAHRAMIKLGAQFSVMSVETAETLHNLL